MENSTIVLGDPTHILVAVGQYSALIRIRIMAQEFICSPTELLSKLQQETQSCPDCLKLMKENFTMHSDIRVEYADWTMTMISVLLIIQSR